MVTDFTALRAVIGGIAFLLVPVVYVGNWVLFTHHIGDCFLPNPRIPGSLSGYYYTHMRGMFVGAMCAMGIFLAAYRGYDKRDNRFTTWAGIAAICIALSPTMPPSYKLSPKGPNLFFTRSNLCGPATLVTYQQSPHQRLFGVFHVVSLFGLFLMVFLMVLVQFTRTVKSRGRHSAELIEGGPAWWKSLRAWWKSLFPADAPNPRKNRRNRIYVLCAGWIALSALLAIVTAIQPSVGQTVPLLLIAECIAFVFFGIAWYVKGAASAPPDHAQLLVRVLSRTVHRWLADLPGDQP